jgi:hypothetical protein
MHLPHHRRSRTLRDHLCRALANALAFGIGLEAVVLATAGAQVPGQAESGTAAWSQQEQPPAAVARLLRRYDCSTVGFGDSEIPRSALIRDAAGRLRMVSFDRGWAVHTGDGRAVLVAVCLEPGPGAAS